MDSPQACPRRCHTGLPDGARGADTGISCTLRVQPPAEETHRPGFSFLVTTPKFMLQGLKWPRSRFQRILSLSCPLREPWLRNNQCPGAWVCMWTWTWAPGSNACPHHQLFCVCLIFSGHAAQATPQGASCPCLVHPDGRAEHSTDPPGGRCAGHRHNIHTDRYPGPEHRVHCRKPACCPDGDAKLWAAWYNSVTHR